MHEGDDLLLGLHASQPIFDHLHVTQTLLDKDDFGDALPHTDSSSEHGTERWREQYEVVSPAALFL